MEMNSSDGFALNGTVEVEDALPSELSTSDSNANVNNSHQSKGAIPKIRPTKSNSISKKSVKLNNNEEVLIPKNGTDMTETVYQLHSDIMRFNGYSPSSLSRNYLDDYKNVYRSTSGNCENCEVINSQNDDNEDSIETNQFLEQPQVVLYQPSCSTKDVDSNMLLKVDTESNCSDETELLSISDDGCIYTYKGDHVADLPSSFFSLDVPLARSPEVPSNRQDNASPEMDFLEMDFDPGPSGDADSDSQSNADMENAENLPQDPSYCSMNNACDFKVTDQGASPEHGFVHLNPESDREATPPVTEVKHTEKELEVECDRSSSTNDDETVEVASSITEMIRKIPKTPWSCSLSERSVASNIKHTSRYSRRLHCTLGEYTLPTEKVCSPIDEVSVYMSHRKINGSQNKSKSTMIWTEEEASKKQITQIGASACGATAVLNVLNALRLPVPSIEKIREAVKTRVRLYGGTLTEYLLSRSVAGSTHIDLINGLSVLSEGQIYARFFHMYPERVVNLNEWLQFWISHGAVPIATLNLQKTHGHGTIPDAWHHQMIFGVGEREIYFTNPLECVDVGQLWPQLSSESILLIRKEDVLSRWNLKTDLTELMNVSNERWCTLNVVGQVANMIRQSRKEPRLGFTSASHIKIPAAYLSGITLAISKNAPLFPILMYCPELPLLPTKDEAVGYSNSSH